MIFSSWFRSRAYNIICILRRGYRRGSASVGSKVKNYLPVSKGIKGRYWKKSEKSRWNIWRERVKGCTFAPAFRKEMRWYLKGLHKQLEGSTRAGGIRFLREGGRLGKKEQPSIRSRVCPADGSEAWEYSLIRTEAHLEKTSRCRKAEAKRQTIYNEEFDPGSGWTLATGLTHASRGAASEKLRLIRMATGEWVSNTYPTCRPVRNRLPKGKLMPHEVCFWHQRHTKAARRWVMGMRPISLLAG